MNLALWFLGCLFVVANREAARGGAFSCSPVRLFCGCVTHAQRGKERGQQAHFWPKQRVEGRMPCPDMDKSARMRGKKQLLDFRSASSGLV